MRSVSICRLSVILFLLAAYGSGALAAFLPSDTVYVSKIGKKLKRDTVYALETSCADCPVHTILDRLDEFQPVVAATYPTDPAMTYWIHLLLIKDTDSITRINVSNGWNDITEGYFLPGNGNAPQVSKSGTLLPASQRAMDSFSSSMQFNFPPSADTASLLLKIQNRFSGYPPQLDFSLLSDKSFHEFTRKVQIRNNISIAFQGAVCVMLLFMMLIYVQNRDKVYLYYSLYMLGIMLYLSSTIQSNIYVNYVFREFPLIGLYLNYPIQLLFYMAYNQFVSAFLDLKKTDPWLHRKILQMNLTFAGVLVATVIYQLLTADALTVGKAWTGISALMIVAYMLLIYRLVTHIKTPYAPFLIVGMIIFMAAAVACMILVNFVRPRMAISPYNILEIGFFLEILCFSMGLGYKMWQTNKDRQRIQEAYIRELKRNEAIIQEANLQLEQKVKERTSEVIRKNKEIEDERKKQMAGDYERRLAIAEMSALRAQMNPHFMFNSMNTLEAFILEKQEKEASRFLNKFSKLLRLVLENSRQLLVSVEKDMEALELYIQLEQIRYDNRFSYDIQIDQRLVDEGYSVPPLIIQPFVENAIVHGLFNKSGHGKLDIRLQMLEDKIYCCIEDDGIGRELAQEIRMKNNPHHRSLGLKVTGERIEILNQIHQVNVGVRTIDLVDSEGEPAGTKVEIYLPLL